MPSEADAQGFRRHFICIPSGKTEKIVQIRQHQIKLSTYTKAKQGISDCLFYSGLNLNQYSVASPCRTICTVCGFVTLS
ncbi:TPA: hypothetical protein WHZ46_001522 [Neisseria meningitidis]